MYYLGLLFPDSFFYFLWTFSLPHQGSSSVCTSKGFLLLLLLTLNYNFHANDQGPPSSVKTTFCFVLNLSLPLQGPNSVCTMKGSVSFFKLKNICIYFFKPSHSYNFHVKWPGTSHLLRQLFIYKTFPFLTMDQTLCAHEREHQFFKFFKIQS